MKKAKIASCEVFISAQDNGNVYAQTFYTSKTGLELLNLYSYEKLSDVLDVAFVRYSVDNGKTWSQPIEWKTLEKQNNGWMLRFFSCGYVDVTDRFFMFVNEGTYPKPDITPGNCYRHIRYMVSDDGGKTFYLNEPVIHKGNEFDEAHPLPHIWIGKNECVIGDMGCCPITLSDGTILMPFHLSRLDEENKKLYTPYDGLDHFWSSAVLLGRWTSDGKLEWEMSQPIWGDSKYVTLGLFEPTISELDGDKILMIMRGSNHSRPDLPAYRWMSISNDGGRSFSEPVPWRYDNGELFFSPSSMSQLLSLSDGRLLWIGNISERNCNGNNPRYPLVLGEVDKQTGLLIRDSVTLIDTKREDENQGVSLSNFYARQDRQTKELVLHIWRYAAKGPASEPVNYADSLIYRIDVGKQ